jgi:hypothetical protein
VIIDQPPGLHTDEEGNSLLHRERSRPRVIILSLILILMVWLILSIDLGLSVVEIVDFCHIRQSSGDFRSFSFAME